jgi:hypothetical protein
MIRLLLCLSLVFGLLSSPAAAQAAQDKRCVPDGPCIALDSYIPDVCAAIETLARRNALDVGFFARLLWRESLFDAGAVSPAGALGIAQFMPGTAKLRGLADPFDPAQAMAASAAYLAELVERFGSLGLAAVAYNAGEARAEKFLAGNDWLPGETEAYVQAITGHAALEWRDAPPEKLDLALAPGRPFREACMEQAEGRSIAQFRVTVPILPWGVILASAPARGAVEKRLAQIRRQAGGVIGGEEVAFTRSRLPGRPGQRHVAQIGRDSRADAEALCARLRAQGAACMVLKN